MIIEMELLSKDTFTFLSFGPSSVIAFPLF